MVPESPNREKNSFLIDSGFFFRVVQVEIMEKGGLEMFKTAAVSFRTRQELLELLDHVSRESECSRSSLIETILQKFLADKDGNGVQVENQVEIKGGAPAADEGELSDGIVYISMGKLRIGLPKDLGCKIIFDEKNSAFRLDLLPGEENLSNVVELRKEA